MLDSLNLISQLWPIKKPLSLDQELRSGEFFNKYI